MSNDTITLALEGPATLDDYAVAMHRFRILMNLLSREIARDVDIEWQVTQLEKGSLLTGITGFSVYQPIVTQVVDAAFDSMEAIREERQFPYSQDVAEAFAGLTDILKDERITAVGFRNSARQVTVIEPFDVEREPAGTIYALGTITGTVEMVTRRGHLRANVYDPLFDKPIDVRLDEEQAETMTKLLVLKQRVTVAGRISHDPETGRPLRVQDVRYIQAVPIAEPGQYRRASGVLPWHEGDENPEDIIRRMRDAS